MLKISPSPTKFIVVMLLGVPAYKLTHLLSFIFMALPLLASSSYYTIPQRNAFLLHPFHNAIRTKRISRFLSQPKKRCHVYYMPTLITIQNPFLSLAHAVQNFKWMCHYITSQKTTIDATLQSLLLPFLSPKELINKKIIQGISNVSSSSVGLSILHSTHTPTLTEIHWNSSSVLF